MVRTVNYSEIIFEFLAEFYAFANLKMFSIMNKKSLRALRSKIIHNKK